MGTVGAYVIAYSQRVETKVSFTPTIRRHSERFTVTAFLKDIKDVGFSA